MLFKNNPFAFLNKDSRLSKLKYSSTKSCKKIKSSKISSAKCVVLNNIVISSNIRLNIEYFSVHDIVNLTSVIKSVVTISYSYEMIEELPSALLLWKAFWDWQFPKLYKLLMSCSCPFHPGRNNQERYCCSGRFVVVKRSWCEGLFPPCHHLMQLWSLLKNN